MAAVGSVLSAAVIAVTVILAARQLRLTTRQLDQLRRSTQLEGAMTIFVELTSPEFAESTRFIHNELPERMKDPEFRRGVALADRAPDVAVHKELHAGRLLECIGAYVKHGLLDGEIIYDVAFAQIKTTWEAVSDVVAVRRAAAGPTIWENFESLYNNAMRWGAEQGMRD